jgi:hypothetical protein
MKQMCNLLITITVAAVFFGLAMLAMAVGLMLRGKIMRGGCGSHSTGGSCEVCSKKKINLCDDEDESGMDGPSFAGTMGRYHKK